MTIDTSDFFACLRLEVDAAPDFKEDITPRCYFCRQPHEGSLICDACKVGTRTERLLKDGYTVDPNEAIKLSFNTQTTNQRQQQ